MRFVSKTMFRSVLSVGFYVQRICFDFFSLVCSLDLSVKAREDKAKGTKM